MRYLGVRALEVTVVIDKKLDGNFESIPATTTIVDLLEKYGPTFKVMMPENVNTLNDAKYIAFECITGFPYVQEFHSLFEIKLDCIKHRNEDFIYCMTIAELKDFGDSAVREYVKKSESIEACDDTCVECVSDKVVEEK